MTKKRRQFCFSDVDIAEAAMTTVNAVHVARHRGALGNDLASFACWIVKQRQKAKKKKRGKS